MVTWNFCHKVYKNQSSLVRHLKVHRTGRLRLSCTLCNKTYGRIDNFRRHFNSHSIDYRPPRIFAPREEAVVPTAYERPTEATGRILLPVNPRFRTISATPKTSHRKPSRIPIVVLPHRARTRYHRGFLGRALPRHFPSFPEWHQRLIQTCKINNDLYLSDEETSGPPTPSLSTSSMDATHRTSNGSHTHLGKETARSSTS